jgi:hypothetical protein
MMDASGPFFRAARGVRRRRDEGFEIEPLDAQTMRQHSYNYFQSSPQTSSQQQTQHPTQTQTSLRMPTFRSSLRHSPASRKRQRTLAEQMEELSLARGASAAARFVELDEHGRERSVSDGGSDDSGEDDEASDGDQGEMLVYGGVPSAMRRFFEPPQRDRRPLDRIYRHYISLATKHHRDATDANGGELVLFRRPPASLASGLALPDAGSDTRGGMALPRYLSITPRDFQALSTEEKRQWYQTHVQYLAQQHGQERENSREDTNTDGKIEWISETDKHEVKATPLPSVPSFSYRRSRSSSASSSGSFRALGVPTTDEERVSLGSGDDIEMMEDDDVLGAPAKVPHLAGAITHTEWFTDEEL